MKIKHKKIEENHIIHFKPLSETQAHISYTHIGVFKHLFMFIMVIFHLQLIKTQITSHQYKDVMLVKLHLKV